MAEALCNHFASKWNATSESQSMDVINSITANDGIDADITTDDISNALSAIRDQSKLDSMGHTILALEHLIDIVPDTAADFINAIASNCAFMSHIQIRLCTFGKSEAHSLASNVRAIAPLPAIAAIIDAILANRLNAKINSI